MNDGVAIKVEHVSKKYCKSLRRSMIYGVKDISKNILGMSSHSENLRKDEFWALDDVSFEVKKGETLGIIGPNGSGKTTLLKLLNGIFWPDKGKIALKGKVGALIEIGAGFHPLLTGRENVYINAAILGMTKKEVDRKFDDIVEFADIGDFIDTPVKFYSSGMFVRLGFAVAVHCDPDILLVDEVLAVGDSKFAVKCSNKMRDLKNRGTTIILVSHNMQAVTRTCQKSVLLQKGKLSYFGATENTVSLYFKLNNERKKFQFDDYINVSIDKDRVKYNESLAIFFEKKIKIFNKLGLVVKKASGSIAFTKFLIFDSNTMRFIFNVQLADGVYSVSVSTHIDTLDHMLSYDEEVFFFEVYGCPNFNEGVFEPFYEVINK